MRIENHPILDFKKGKKISFTFDGKEMTGYEKDTIAAALHDNDVKVFRKSIKEHRPRGFFCAIGKCSSCFMTVNGVPNVRVCVEPLKEGMEIKTQTNKGDLSAK